MWLSIKRKISNSLLRAHKIESLSSHLCVCFVHFVHCLSRTRCIPCVCPRLSCVHHCVREIFVGVHLSQRCITLLCSVWSLSLQRFLFFFFFLHSSFASLTFHVILLVILFLPFMFYSFLQTTITLEGGEHDKTSYYVAKTMLECVANYASHPKYLNLLFRII